MLDSITLKIVFPFNVN